MVGPRRLRVFLSYARADVSWAQGLAKRLAQDEGGLAIDVLLDQDLSPGGSWRDQLDGALDSAQAVVLLLSEAYAHSDFAQRELERVQRRPVGDLRAVVAILIDGPPPEFAPRIRFLPSDGVPLAHARDPVKALDQVAADLRELLGDAPPEPQTRPAPRPLSSSVQRAIRDMGEPVSSVAIVASIVELHGEYGDNTGKLLTISEPAGAEQLPAQEWLERVRELYSESEVPTLHGRFVIRGLAMLDPRLAKELLEFEFLSKLEQEMEPRFTDALTTLGQRRFAPGDIHPHGDRPAQRDRLRRKRFAADMAEMIDDERQRSADDASGRAESFLVHLHGPWGSGKSTLLGFMQADLEQQGWIVVQFNAWQQERLEAPWWSLMTAVHRTARRSVARPASAWRFVRLLGMELWWRIRLGWMAYLLLPAVVGLLWYGADQGWFETSKPGADWLTQAGDIAKPVAAVLSVVVVLFGAARGLSRSFAAGSARGADTFLRTSQDPMRTLTRRYERIVRVAGRPIAVFVDDLDRCQSAYVVEVLQGIQTLLIDAPVTYVVAADGRWLYDSYAKVYCDFVSVGQDPGRPLGHLFLEKTFQLAAALPGMAPEVRDDYWHGLLHPEAWLDEEPAPDVTEWARKQVEGAGFDDVLDAVGDSQRLSAQEKRATSDAASDRLSDADVRQEIEHRLMAFAPLLESNPRAMKRLLNAYRIELRRLLAEGRQIGTAAITPDQLALWTILSMRWPLLAAHFAKSPELLSGEGSVTTSEGLHDLWRTEEVQAVIQGDDVPARLTEAAVRALVGGARPRQRRAVPVLEPADLGPEPHGASTPSV